MKRKYAPGLTPTERHRISDALYRMKKEGFENVDQFDVSKITKVKTYDDIYKEVVKYNKNLMYRPYSNDRTSRARTAVRGSVGYRVSKAKREWNKAVTRARFSGKKVSDAKYDLRGMDPDQFFNYRSNKSVMEQFQQKRFIYLSAVHNPQTNEEIQKLILQAEHEGTMLYKQYLMRKFEQNLLKHQRTLEKGPITAYWNRVKICKSNLLKSFRTNIHNPDLLNPIVNAISKMSIQQFEIWFDQFGAFVQDELFGYKADLINHIEEWLPTLVTEINIKPYGKLPVDTVIEMLKDGIIDI